MTISKSDQLDRDYRRVTRTRPWLIPTRWAAPRPLEDYTPAGAKDLNARLKDAYRQRRARAVVRAKAVVEATTEDIGRWGREDLISRGIPKATTADLPRGWRSRELRGNRRSPSSSESMRKLETANRRARLRVAW